MTSQNIVTTNSPANGLSIVQGPTDVPLWEKTLGQLIIEQAKELGSRTALVVPWQNVRFTYDDLAHRSSLIAKALLDTGLKYGDSIGVFAGNCHQYIELFLGAARIGCPFVVLNTTSSPHELSSIVARSACKMVFVASNIGSVSFSAHIEELASITVEGGCLERLVLLDPAARRPTQPIVECEQYAEFSIRGTSIFMNDAKLRQAQRKVRPGDVLNMQFTSGTTGLPKASMLTHNNLINNGRYVGMAMRLTEQDVICCPPPLFHCFGLVMGFLASFTHGSTVVFPSDRFNARQTIDAVIAEKATALLGVPTMFVAELEELESTSRQISTVRTGLVSGSPVSPSLMEQLRGRMNIQGMLIAYGMTETSPVTFIASLDDPDDRLLTSLGRVLPHTAAKVVDQEGKVVPFGTRGEICTSGFALQKGYFRDAEKTNEAMRKDENGVLWMHTGDEGYLDEEGYGFITGRIKDLIIRGGENLSPSEIENQLLRHPAINEACVVGARDKRHGEVVVAFLKVATGVTKISDQEIKDWVKKDLGSVKVPVFTFWVGQDGINSELPKTGSGKYQKHLIRELANRLIEEIKAPRARL
ncbi:hypothetical protein FSARC_8279 [Fusarium sarcochroum]|uniref:Uncharacterized protein n=1 Tax=Fusarium sarcochroum TaxID=1208366 RepID=A0A8H4TTF1_9HYPO|nr:hypothetical protein FSARC_8279 [Fusarium sarcochroum]